MASLNHETVWYSSCTYSYNLYTLPCRRWNTWHSRDLVSVRDIFACVQGLDEEFQPQPVCELVRLPIRLTECVWMYASDHCTMELTRQVQSCSTVLFGSTSEATLRRPLNLMNVHTFTGKRLIRELIFCDVFSLNTSRPQQNGCPFAEDNLIFFVFWDEF